MEEKQASERFPFPANPNGWFRVAYSRELARGEIKPLHLLGRELVLYRDEEGQAHMMDAFCQHLGAHLGHGGCLEGSAIRCPFHHWLWGADGELVEVPYAKRRPPKARMHVWDISEKNGLVMVWHHATGEPPAYQLPDLEQYGSDEWTDYEIRRWKVKSRWLDMNENAVDRIHFLYVHGTHTAPETDVEVDGHLLRCRSRMKMGSGQGEFTGGIDTTDYGPGFQTVDVTGAVDTLMVNTATPIDDEYTDVSFAYSVNTSGGADAARGVGRAIIKDLEHQMAQDIVIWENKKYFDRPMLCDGDGEFGQYRRWMRQFFSENW